jgi:hypothetical protein
MPTYAALLYHDEDADWSDDAHQDMTAEYGAFGADAASVIRGGAALRPTTTATTISVKKKGGEVVTSDGPYAETKEILGGFFLLECADLDEAITWASKIPAAWNGKVELRPIIPM